MTLVKDLGMQFQTTTSIKKIHMGLYKCPDCGKIFRTNSYAVKQKRVSKCKSCAMKTHGYCSNPLYLTWWDEKDRCSNKGNSSYQYYGGRGITFSKIFLDFTLWYKYVSSLPNYEKENYTLDRINNNKGYEVGNLRWATKSIQQVNRGKQSNNTSGYVGVYFDKSRSKWRVTVKINKKEHYIGRYITLKNAVEARNNYIIKNNLPHSLQIYKGGTMP